MDSNLILPENGSLLSPPVAEMDEKEPKIEIKIEETPLIEVENQKAGTSSSTGLPFDSPVSVEIEPANIEVKEVQVNECGACGTVTTPLLKEDGQLGSVEGGYEMSQISPHGRVFKHNVNEDEDTFWISCDECQRWFHGRCVLVEEYQDGLIEKFYCPACTQIRGPSRMRQVVAPHRLAFDDQTQINQPPEIGTRIWVENFVQWEQDIPEPDDSHVTFFENGYEFTERFNRNENWSKVFHIKDPKGLELRMPPPGFGTADLVRIFGEQHQVDTIDVYRQVTHSMTLGSFQRHYKSQDRDRIYNFLSLEFSKNEQMKDLVAPPIIVYELSFVHKFWPDKSDPINYDEEMDFLPEHACLAKEIEVAEEHKKSRPDVALFCLCGMGGSYTDFHIDFGGSSVWYHIYKGQKVFYIAEPSARNLKAYEEHQTLEKRTERFLGDLLMAGELRRIVINEGETLMIPSGWIHAVYTPVDSLVFGGNFLHQLNIPMQLKVYDIEQKTRAEIGMDEKFLFPQFELVHWYAARSSLLMAIKEDNDQGKQSPPTIFNGAKAILPYLKRWIDKDEQTLGKQAVVSYVEVYRKLKREFDVQDRMRREENGDGDSGRKRKGAKKSKKKKKEDSDEDDDYRPKLKMKISRAKMQKTEENGEEEPGPIEIARNSDHFADRIIEEVDEDDEQHEKFGIRFTKKGSKYSSELVEKPTPMIGEVNMAQMFARRSSSGRTPKVAGWLVATAGDEIEKEAKKLEEIGDMPKAREPVVYTKAMDKLMAEEDKEDEEFEERKRKKSKNEKVHVPAPSPAPPKKSQGATAKQRLASKLGLRR